MGTEQDLNTLTTKTMTEIADFGLACSIGTEFGGGTTAFLPPETLRFSESRGQYVCARVPRHPNQDMFALGISALDIFTTRSVDFEQLHGAVRKGGNAIADLVTFTVAMTVHQMRSRGGLEDVSNDDLDKLSDFIAKCLHGNPSERLTPQRALSHPFLLP
jgi:serine/threonine protein kinase